MKRAIIVKGQSNSGKTKIIRWLYRWLRLYYKPVITNYRSTSLLPWSGDFSCDLQIGRLKISIQSEGDTESQVVLFLNNCLTNGCNIIIGACRAKGRTNHAVRNILQPHSATKTVVTSFVHTYNHSNPKLFNKQCIAELRTYLIGLAWKMGNLFTKPISFYRAIRLHSLLKVSFTPSNS